MGMHVYTYVSVYIYIYTCRYAIIHPHSLCCGLHTFSSTLPLRPLFHRHLECYRTKVVEFVAYLNAVGAANLFSECSTPPSQLLNSRRRCNTSHPPVAQGAPKLNAMKTYPLVNVHIAMERSTIFNGKTHYQSPFSIATSMLNYHRVSLREDLKCEGKQDGASAARGEKQDETRNAI